MKTWAGFIEYERHVSVHTVFPTADSQVWLNKRVGLEIQLPLKISEGASYEEDKGRPEYKSWI
jgi:hypothetical protein